MTARARSSNDLMPARRASCVYRKLRVSSLFFVWLCVGACETELSNTGFPVDEESPLGEALGPGIHPVISIPGWTPNAGSGLFEVHLHLVSVGITEGIGSFQGELRYDSQIVEVLGGKVPAGLLGAWNVVASGVIRFAGVSLEGLDELAVLTINVRSSRTLEDEDFEVWLDKVTATEGYESLDHQVVKRPHPVITGERVGVDPT